MDCGVCIGGAGEPIREYDVEIVRARKAHKCMECGRPIPKGSEYEVVTGFFDDEVIRWKTCMDCHYIGEGLSCDGRIHGTLWTDLEGSGPGDTYAAFAAFTQACVAKVETAAAKAYLVQRWQAWKGLAA